MKGNKKTIIYVGIIVILIIILVSIIIRFNSANKSNTNNSSNFGKQNSNQNVEMLTSSVTQKDNRGEETYDDYSATINLSNSSSTGNGVTIDGTTIKITSAGTYYFSGSIEDGNIVVEAGDDDNVVLVFDNATITSKTTSVINGVNAKNIIINLKEGTTNTFTDSSNYTVFTSEEDSEPDATIFSKTDLKINGRGTLIVNANYGDGIASKDDLVITNATLQIKSADDAIRGKDCVDIKDADISVVATEDAIKSTNDEDEGKGYVIIDGANISISCGDDGIHAETELVINSGSINITKCKEGIEGKFIEINGGDINVISSDDGINATDSSSSGQNNMMSTGSADVQVVINGGTIKLNCEGDSLDANGALFQTGGDIVIAGTTSGGNGILDYDLVYKITGGSIIGYGTSDMWQSPSDSSTQYSLGFAYSGNSGDKIELKDSSNNTVASFTAEKKYSSILISNSSITNGETYTLYVNGEDVSSQEVTSIVTSNVSGSGMMGGQNGMNGRMRQMNN